jgi:type II secretory ATPase GspE/PulE/Tfp pilus assembly ATPase PilB-like protein
MVGEIRDSQTAELAVRAALTGHLVLTTLHTKDSLSVVARLKNLGVEPYLIASVLRGSAAQRLVRRLCPACRKSYKPLKRERDLLARYSLKAEKLYSPVGCKQCRNTGFRGRIAIFEMFEADETIENMLVSGKREAELRAYLTEKGIRQMAAEGLAKAVEGITAVSEVERVVSS